MTTALLLLSLLSGAAAANDQGRTVVVTKKAGPDEAAGIGLRIRRDSAGGLRIVYVHPAGPAAAAGLKAGDSIYSIQGRPVSDMALKEVLRRMRGAEGAPIELEAGPLRKEARLYQLLRRTRPAPPDAGTHHAFGGIGVRLRASTGAVVIAALIPGSPAEASGLRPGARILAVDGREVGLDTPAQSALRIRGPDRSIVTLQLQEAGEAIRVIQIARRTLVLEHREGLRVQRRERRAGESGLREKCTQMEWHDCQCARDCDSNLCQEEWWLTSEDEVSCDYKITECFCSVCA